MPSRRRQPAAPGAAGHRSGTGAPHVSRTARSRPNSPTWAPSSSSDSGTVRTDAAASSSRWKPRPYDSTASGPRNTPGKSSRKACAKPEQITIRPGSVRTPRARARYSVRASRSSTRPAGSPGPKAALGACWSARRYEASQAARGNDEASGVPWRRSCRGPRARGGAFFGTRSGAPSGSARSATRVPDPWRAVSQPSATSSAYASATVLRATPRSAASERYGGSRVPGASLPSRTASRSARISAARRPPGPDSSRCRSAPIRSAELTHDSAMKMHPTAGLSGP